MQSPTAGIAGRVRAAGAARPAAACAVRPLRPSAAPAREPRAAAPPAGPAALPPRPLVAAPAPAPRAPRVAARSGGPPDASFDPKKVYSKAFIASRLVTFAGIVLGYSCFYLTRNSLTYTAPVMVATPSLGIDITMVGAMTSIFPIAYGFSKFVAGVLGAKLSPGVLLGGGLMATAAVNVMFGFGSSLAWFCVMWGLNGILQVTPRGPSPPRTPRHAAHLCHVGARRHPAGDPPARPPLPPPPRRAPAARRARGS